MCSSDLSQMAEAFTRSMLPANAPIEVFSAGVDPVPINSETVAVMKEAGIDMKDATSKSIDQVPFDTIDLVITLCDDARRSCPAPPIGAHRIHWGLKDPAEAAGSPEEVRAAFRATRDEVLTCVKRLMFELATTRSLRGSG